MATSYQELKRRVALMVDREDAQEQETYDNATLDMLDIFIDDAQRRFYRDEVARTPPFEFYLQVPVAAGTDEFSVPQGYFELRYAEAMRGDVRHTLERTSFETINNTDLTSRVYLPTRIAYASNRLKIDRVSEDINIDLYYYASLPNLRDVVGETNTHWLLNHADDLIAYWAAADAARYFTASADMIQVWEARAEEIRSAIIKQDKRARQSGSTPRIGRHYRNGPRISPSIGTTGARR